MLSLDHREVWMFSVRGSLEHVETKAGHGAWFFSSCLEANAG